MTSPENEEQPSAETTIDEETGLKVEPLFPEDAAIIREKKPIRRTRRARSVKSAPIDRKGFRNQIVGVHKLLATLTNNPVVAITDTEGEALANAAADIIEEYQLAVSRRAILWGNLIGACGLIYGPKIMVAMKSRPAKAPPAPKPPKGGPMETPPASAFKMNFSGLA